MRAPWLLKKAGANSMSFVPAYALAAAMLVECRSPTKSQPGGAVVIWKGGATKCVRSDF